MIGDFFCTLNFVINDNSLHYKGFNLYIEIRTQTKRPRLQWKSCAYRTPYHAPPVQSSWVKKRLVESPCHVKR